MVKENTESDWFDKILQFEAERDKDRKRLRLLKEISTKSAKVIKEKIIARIRSLDEEYRQKENELHKIKRKLEKIYEEYGIVDTLESMMEAEK